MRSLPRSRRRWLICCTAITLVLPRAMRADKSVALAGSADPAYVAARSKNGELTPQTYVFMEGKFTPGMTVDPSLDKCRFETLAKNLAVDLAAQSFFPAKTLDSADLLLVIHWGATSPRRHQAPIDVHDNRANISTVNDGTSGVFLQDDVYGVVGDSDRTFRTDLEWGLLMRENNAVRDPVALQSDASILGVSDDLRAENDRPFSTTHGEMVRAMLDEERYFVVVMAFDAKVLRETKKLRRLWISKLSIRSPGVNFGTALERMGQVGARYFGTAVQGLKVERARVREGQVKIGEAIVIEKQIK